MASTDPSPTIPDLDQANVVSSLDRALWMVSYIQQNRGARLSDIAAEFNISKSSAHRYLKTLCEHGYLVKEEGTYHVGLRFLDPGIHARRRKDAYKILEPKIDQLADETGERAQFITEENGLGIHVFSAVGENGVNTTSRVGELVHLHTTSAGKCILSELPGDRVAEIIERHGLPELTENSITTEADLLAELAKVTERGYACNKGEGREQMAAVGVPILTPDDEILGSISVSGPMRRMEQYSDLPDILLSTADEIMLRLEYPE